MATTLEQIENHMGPAKAGTRKWMKNQRNRKIRRESKKLDKPVNIKYRGWEY
jgi:hypothetical protein